MREKNVGPVINICRQISDIYPNRTRSVVAGSGMGWWSKGHSEQSNVCVCVCVCAGVDNLSD